MNLDRMFQAGVALTILGVVWAVWPQPGDAAYASLNRRHRSVYRRGPKVIVDRAHWNRSPADPHFEGLSQLLRSDGYQVTENRQALVPELMRTANVLVIPNAMGWKGALQHWANAVGIHLRPEAFSESEAAAVRDWVQHGGSMLLVADRSPAGTASGALATALGIRIDDCAGSDTGTVMWFDRSAGLSDDPIDSGRPDEGEEINFAMSFGGGHLSGPPGSMTFLTVSPKAVLGDPRRSACASGKAQGVAYELGRGRVVVVTAQLARIEGLAKRAGVDDRLTDNRQLVLNIMHWLSRAQ